MEARTYLESSNIISPLGWDTLENVQSVLNGRDGIGICGDRSLSPLDLPLALLDWDEMEGRFSEVAGLEREERFTRFEKAGILSIYEALAHSLVDPADPETLLILSTTKGNVELLDDMDGFEKERLFLWKSAE